jgi:uncharacterized protein YihD (DUF1040 family)
LADLANQNEYREQMAYLTAQPSIYAMKVCAEEASVMISGLKYLYHLCYRCESGQEVLRARNVNQVINLAYKHYTGDPDVMYQCRRLELSLKQDGWRGNVDEFITTNDLVTSTAASSYQSIHEHESESKSPSLRSADRLRFQYEEQSVHPDTRRSSNSSVSSGLGSPGSRSQHSIYSKKSQLSRKLR